MVNIDNIITINTDEVKNLSEITQHLSSFAARSANEYSEQFVEHLILHTMSKLSPGFRSIETIYKKFTEITKVPMTRDQVLEGLRRLASKDDSGVHSRNANSDFHAEFRLETDTVSRLAKEHREFSRFEDKVIQKWLSELEQRYDITREQLEQLKSDLQFFSVRFYSQHSLQSVLNFFDTNNVEPILEALDRLRFEDIFPIRDSILDPIRKLEIPAFFHSEDPDFQKLITKQLNAYFALHMFQLHPAASKAIADHVPGGYIYVDTNFIFRLLGQNGEKSVRQAAVKLVRKSQSLGYQFKVSPKTVDEYLRVLDSFLKSSSRFPDLTPETAASALEATYDEGLYQHFLRIVRDGNYFSAEAYRDRYSRIEKILAKEYDIEVDDTHHEFLQSRDSEIAAEASRLRTLIPEWSGSDAACEHDAFIRLLVLACRQGTEAESALETRYWFLTCDSKLPKYDRRARPRDDYKIPFCILSSHWIRTIAPFAVSEDDYTQAKVAVQESNLFHIFKLPNSDVVKQILSYMTLETGEAVSTSASLLADRIFVRSFSEKQSQEERKVFIEEHTLAQLVREQEQKDKERQDAIARAEKAESIMNTAEARARKAERKKLDEEGRADREAKEKTEERAKRKKVEAENEKLRKQLHDVQTAKLPDTAHVDNLNNKQISLDPKPNSDHRNIEPNEAIPDESYFTKSLINRERKFWLIITIALISVIYGLGKSSLPDNLVIESTPQILLTSSLIQFVGFWGIKNRVFMVLLIVVNIYIIGISLVMISGVQMENILAFLARFVGIIGGIASLVALFGQK